MRIGYMVGEGTGAAPDIPLLLRLGKRVEAAGRLATGTTDLCVFPFSADEGSRDRTLALLADIAHSGGAQAVPNRQVFDAPDQR